MSGFCWVLAKSTAITMLLGLLLAGWAHTVWTFTQSGLNLG